MRIQLESQGFDVTPPIRGHVDDQVAFHLSNFSAHVSAVNVYLSDINGPRGGPDKRVVVDVSLGRFGAVTVEQTREDLYAAVRQAARQAGRAVRRTLGRARRMERLATRELRHLSR